MNGYDTEVRRGYWQALRAVALDAMPPVIQPQPMINLLSDCQFRNVQMALCMVSSSDRLHTLVLLRANGRSQGDAAQCAEEVGGLLQAQFEDAGFAVGEATNDLLEKLLPCGYESGALFHASETEGGYYIPADLGKIPPIDWAGISSALCRAKQAVFMVHFMPTVLLEAEKRIIDENLRYLEAKGADAAVYEQLKASADETLYFVAISMFGDLRTKREIAMILNRCFLHEMVLPTKMLNEIENLCVLPYRFANELAECGHTWTGQLMPVMQRFSHLMKKEQAAMCFVLPHRVSELSGVKLNTVPRQNLLLPEPMCCEKGIWVGETDGQNQKVYVPFEWLPLHMAIVGMPGMGKTTCAIGILKQIYDAGYPFLIIEPTKTEYRALIDCIPDLRVYTAGRSDLSPLAINPFLPPKGVTLEQFKPSLISVFMAAFSMTSPLDVIFPDVVNEAYTRFGWRNSSTRDSKGVKHFGIQEFICVFRECVQRSNYDQESKMNLETGGTYRLQALLNTNRMLFDTERSLDFDELLEHPTLIELDAIDNAEQKSLVMSIVLVNLMLAIRRRQNCDAIFKNAIMIDEAHLLLGQHLGAANEHSAKAGQSAVQLLQNLVVTIRAYGTGLIFADQSPRKMTEEIVGNCNFKLMFHLENMADRRILAHAMGLTELMMQDVRQMNPGEAYIGCSRLPVPLRIKTPHFKKELKLRELISDDEIRAHRAEIKAGTLPFSYCDLCGCCVGECDYACRDEADFLAQTICIKVSDASHSTEGLKEIVENRRELVQGAIRSLSVCQFNVVRLEKCTMLHLLRRLRLMGSGDTEWIEALYIQQQ